jgi:hypothetical protein
MATVARAVEDRLLPNQVENGPPGEKKSHRPVPGGECGSGGALGRRGAQPLGEKVADGTCQERR